MGTFKIDPKGEYTRNQIAEYFGVSKHSVWRWIAEGKIKGEKRITPLIKRKIWFFSGAEILRFERRRGIKD